MLLHEAAVDRVKAPFRYARPGTLAMKLRSTTRFCAGVVSSPSSCAR